MMKFRLHSFKFFGIAAICTSLIIAPLAANATDIQSLENTTSSLQSQLSGINSELLAISEQIDTLEMQIVLTDSEIARTNTSLEAAKNDEDAQYEDMKTRIKYMYENGNSNFLEMLFSSKNLSDFLNKAEFIQNVSTYDRNMLMKLQDTKQQIKDTEASLITQQESLKGLQSQLTTQQAALQQKADETSTDLAAFQAQLSEAKAAEAARLKAEAEAQAAAQAAQTQATASSNTQTAESQNGSTTEQVASTETTNTPDTSTTSTTTNGSTTNSGTSMEAAPDDLKLFAAILNCEAYNDYNSMLAVATVIMNRVNSSIFPNTISEVVYASGQFAPTWNGTLDARLASGPTELAYQVAQDALNGARLAEVSDCYYFLYSGATSTPGVIIGDNVFFQSW